MQRLTIRHICFSFIFLLLFVVAAFGQGTTSRLTGTVLDGSGAVVAGATVTLTNESTSISLTTQTSDNGAYTFDLIQAGVYQVSVEKQGFKKFISKGNAINVSQPATINVNLEVGDVSATVTVDSSIEQVQTSTSGNVGTVVDQKTLESLPIVGARGRNPLDLLNYQPGIVNGANTGGGVHVNGSRDRSFNFTLDGIDINESSAGGSNFTPLRPNPDSIQEFQVVTSNFTAELGRSSGAQVTFVTKSGTNRFSGNIFEYYQTPRFHANEYENNLLSVARRQFVQHIYGGSFGGPLVLPGFGEGTPIVHVLKDRAFFFTNIQFLRASETRLAQRTVYTQTARQGIFRYIRGGRNAPAGTSTSTAFPSGAAVNSAGGQIYANCTGNPPTTPCTSIYDIANNPSGTGIDPRLLAVLNSTPLPNDFGVGDGLNTAGFKFVAPQNEKQYDFVMRFDFKVTDNSQFYVRYAQGEQNTLGDIVNGGLQAFPDTPNLVNTYRYPKNLAANYRWSPTAKFINEFIFGYSTFGFSFETENPDPAIPYAFNLVTTPHSNFSYNARNLRTYQFVDNVTFDLSPHVIKGGINFRLGKQFDDRASVAGSAIESIVNFSRTINSNFTPFNLTALTTGINTNDTTTLQSQINDYLGRVGAYTQAFVATPDGGAFAPAGTRWNFNAFYNEYDFYVQDTWRARPNLTVDLGLRWEPKFSPSSEGLPVLRPDQPAKIGAAPSNTLRWTEGDLFETDWNNFSPSVGLAWDPFSSGKTSIRVNYRLAYDRLATQLFAASIFQSTPGNNFTFPTTNAFGQGGGLLRNLPAITPNSTPNALRQPGALGTGSITIIDPDLVFPEIHSWFAGFQREIGFNSVIEVNYIGKRGTHLLGGYDANQVNLSATDPRCPGQTFLQAFRLAQDASNPANCLATLLSGTNGAGGSPATFRTQFLTQLNQGAAGTVAQTLAQRSGTTSLTTNGFSPFFLMKYPQFTGAVNVIDSNDVSRYHGLEVIFKRRFTKGIGFQVGYTFSKSEDTRSFDPVFTTVSRGAVQSASSTPFDINNRRLNYAWSDFDRRHVVQATYVVEIPIGKGKRFGSDIPTALDLVIGGWQVAGNFNYATGRPFTLYSGVNTFSNAVSSTVNCSSCSRDMGSVVQQNNTNYYFTLDQINTLFSQPNAGEIGNTGRNFFIGPRQFQTDMSLSKKFRFGERYSFDLRVDARNLTNTPSFAAPNANLISTTAPFGRIRESVVSGSRKVQLSAKFNF